MKQLDEVKKHLSETGNTFKIRDKIDLQSGCLFLLQNNIICELYLVIYWSKAHS